MQIRITKELLQFDFVQMTRGEVVDVPAPLAQQFIEEGSAVEVPKEECARLNRQAAALRRPPIAGFVPQKATRR